MEKLRVATVFSGIGAFEHALIKKNIDHEIVFACDNGERMIDCSYEEIMSYAKEKGLDNKQLNKYVSSLYDATGKTNWMKKSYLANYDVKEDEWYEDIRFIDGTRYKGKIDFFVGGSPCQSFSNMGKRGGLEDVRGTLFFDYARLIKEIEPRFFIYENVPGMLNHDKGNTWKTIKSVFESLGYDVHYKILNAVDFGIPQNRKRLFVVGFKEPREDYEFPLGKGLRGKTMFDFLEYTVPANRYLAQKGFEFVTRNPGRARVNQNIIRTQKANQQTNWNGDFVFEKIDTVKHGNDVLSRAYISEYQGDIGVIRQLTPRECLRLMGFSDSFEIAVPDNHMYRQAGNSIVVNVLESLVSSIMEKEIFERKPLKVATVFSGIGAFEFALKRMGIKHEILFACDNGEREIEYDIDAEKKKVFELSSKEEKWKYVEDLYKQKTNSKNYVQMSYQANYPEIKNGLYFQDINLLDGRDYEGQVDIFVGGSPCQSFSSVGFQGGLEDARGTLFYEYARLVKEIKPKVFIYENVRNLINHDHGKTWAVIKSIFDSLGYKYDFAVLNSADYGIPQNRRRLFVVGRLDGSEINMPPKTEKLKWTMKDFSENFTEFGGMTFNSKGEVVLSHKAGIVDNKYTLTPLLYDYVMKGGTKTFYQRPDINKDIARTVLKTMGNRHRAGIDNYMSFDGTENVGSVRMLTEREAHRLMGFTDDYKIVVSRAQAYKQAGNSIVVDVMISLIKEILG